MRATKLTGLTMLAIATLSMWFVYQAQYNADRVFVEPLAITTGR